MLKKLNGQSFPFIDNISTAFVSDGTGGHSTGRAGVMYALPLRRIHRRRGGACLQSLVESCHYIFNSHRVAYVGVSA